MSLGDFLRNQHRSNPFVDPWQRVACERFLAEALAQAPSGVGGPTAVRLWVCRLGTPLRAGLPYASAAGRAMALDAARQLARDALAVVLVVEGRVRLPGHGDEPVEVLQAAVERAWSRATDQVVWPVRRDASGRATVGVPVRLDGPVDPALRVLGPGPS